MPNRGFFLQRALEFARKGVGFTSPNPAVGAVIVKNGKIIGEGGPKRAGGEHGEINALRQAQGKHNVVGATLYVTLEPCCHYGKTSPCVEAIVKSGIKKVVVGMKDPFEKVNGKGIAYLRKHGVGVELLNTKSVLYKEIRDLNQPFIKWAKTGLPGVARRAKTGLPYVVLKAAVSLDGKIATRTGESKWITSPKARDDARLERSLCDAVIVGAGTVLADNPELAAHGRFNHKQFLRVIIDPELTLDVDKRVFRDKNVLVACVERALRVSSPRRRGSSTLSQILDSRFRGNDRERFFVKSFGKTKISIKKLLEYLGKRGIQKVFVEGGAGVHGMFVDECKMQNDEFRIIDEVIFYIAPKIIGGVGGLSAVGGEGVGKLAEALKLNDVRVDQIGEDVKIRGMLKRY